MEKLPKGVSFDWETDLRLLPTVYDIYAVQLKEKATGKTHFSFAEFIPDRPPSMQIDYDQWRVIGGEECFARESEDNRYDVVAWAKMTAVYSKAKKAKNPA